MRGLLIVLWAPVGLPAQAHHTHGNDGDDQWCVEFQAFCPPCCMWGIVPQLACGCSPWQGRGGAKGLLCSVHTAHHPPSTMPVGLRHGF